MADGTEPRTASVRGIYATALTERLRRAADVTVLNPSPPIEARFDADFETGAPAVEVAMTEDRLGVRIEGPSADVKSVLEPVRDVGLDTFSWTAPLPAGAIVAGTVDANERRGWIVDTPAGEGVLPDRATDDSLSVGEELRVQVREPESPWSDDRPRLDAEVRVPGTLLRLRKGVDADVASTPSGEDGRELARTTELLSASVPEGWGVEWRRPATDADMSTLEAALSRAADRATDIDAALEAGPDGEGFIARPNRTEWLRFGRETRFALDDLRASVTETIEGHHRIKAGGESAGAAVDFLEAIGSDIEEFPFGPLTAVFGPREGDNVRIVHGKPEGEEYSLGRGTVTNRSASKARVTVEREMQSSGTYDALGTEREPGDTATTRFAEGRWWYPTVYRGESGTAKGTYVNVATPVEVFPEAIGYVDLHVDVIEHPDGTVNIVDRAELEAARDAGHVPDAVAERAVETAEKVATLLAD
jgi:protein associated with RNAse G/E